MFQNAHLHVSLNQHLHLDQAFTPPNPLPPSDKPKVPTPPATPAPGKGLGNPTFSWATGSDKIDNPDCAETLIISYLTNTVVFKACMSVYHERQYCSFLGYVDCRPVHVPIAATGRCPGDTVSIMKVRFSTKHHKTITAIKWPSCPSLIHSSFEVVSMALTLT